MNKVIIVDDDMVIRVTLRSMIPWEELGYTVVGDFMNAATALDYLESHQVDLMFTDMKMPHMDGIEMMKTLISRNRLPVTVVLSGYNEFDLVRRAFKIGAYDYMLKADLNENSLKNLLIKLNQDIYKSSLSEPNTTTTYNSRNSIEELEEGIYSVVFFQIDDYKKEIARFGDDLKNKLDKPMLELVRQIPRIAAKGALFYLYPSIYVMYYKVTDNNHFKSSIQSTVRQVQFVWKNYMNLTVSAAVSNPILKKHIESSFDEVISLLKFTALTGKGSVCYFGEVETLLKQYHKTEEQYKDMANKLYSADSYGFSVAKGLFFQQISQMDIEGARIESLLFIVLLSERFKEYGDDFHALFPEDVSYHKKLSRVTNLRELELWLNNFFRWVMDYMTNRQKDETMDIMIKAKRFMIDNYSNPELTLKSVADYVGLNEKYFSTKFTKEEHTTFSNYLTDIRLEKAKTLMKTTDLKMYEISDRVGYNHVEHFNRMFKKTFHVSPGDYKKTLGLLNPQRIKI